MMDIFSVLSLVVLFFLFQLQYSERFKHGIYGLLSFISARKLPARLKWLCLSSIAGSLPIKNRTIFASPILYPLHAEKSNKAAITFLTSHFYYFISPLSPALVAFLVLTGYSYAEILPLLLIPTIVFLCLCYKLMPASETTTTKSNATVGDYLFSSSIVLLLGLGFYFKESLLLACAIAVFLIGKDYKVTISKSLVISLALITSIMLLKPTISSFIKSLDISGYPLALALLVGLMTGSSKLSVTLLYGIPMSFADAIMSYPLWWAGYMLSPLHLCPMYASTVFGADYKSVYRQTLLTVLGTVVISELIFSFLFIFAYM
ncbi:MAG: hypothetical protein QIT35_gp05 [Methanophagales virus PBV299]|uniref:Permease n=1 Tax=Methanophagales virus PBV299 TaxID=2987730 RepID=A0ABY6GLV5_9CAUD|nr:MAG: hypothetical protein QIT35_gp05 [Methanophagales virus PBV299]UYL64801.1 MAG: hypothetical protein OFDIEDLO_00005 [Methanophagales virus PBV299]